MIKNISVTIVAREPQIKQSQSTKVGRHRGRRSPQPKQLTLWEAPHAQKEASPYLQIASIPVHERINPKEHLYVLVIQPNGLRACGGQFTAEEAHQIAKLTKGWDWRIDEDGRLRCLPQLEALLDAICKRSSVEGGEWK